MVEVLDTTVVKVLDTTVTTDCFLLMSTSRVVINRTPGCYPKVERCLLQIVNFMGMLSAQRFGQTCKNRVLNNSAMPLCSTEE